MKAKATTWLAQIAVVLVMLAAGAASASSGFLAGNTHQGKNTLEGGFHRGLASVSAETCRGCGEFCSWDAAGLFVAPSSGAARTGPVSQLEVGPYRDLAARSVGDGLTPDHIPSFAAIRANVERQLGRRLNDAEARALRDQTNTIVIRTQTHQQGSRTYGGRNTAQQIQTDSLDLQAAFRADRAALRQRLIQDGHTPEAIDAAFGRLDQLNRQAGRY